MPVAATKIKTLATAALRAEGVRAADFSFAFLSPRAIAALNKRHLHHTGPTDIITFAFANEPGNVLRADIYICVEVARAQAREFGVGLREEIQRLVVHGVLHACGYEHPTDALRTRSRMWRRQELLLRRFLPAIAGVA